MLDLERMSIDHPLSNEISANPFADPITKNQSYLPIKRPLRYNLPEIDVQGPPHEYVSHTPLIVADEDGHLHPK